MFRFNVDDTFVKKKNIILKCFIILKKCFQIQDIWKICVNGITLSQDVRWQITKT